MSTSRCSKPTRCSPTTRSWSRRINEAIDSVKHSDSVNFSTFRTFSIADSVAVINNNKLEGKVRTDVDAAYINAVKDQLVQRGYTLVSKDQSPDLGINISRIYNTSTGYFDYGSYWDPYYGSYWDPYYWGYGGYGYYFPSYYVGSYSITEARYARLTYLI